MGDLLNSPSSSNAMSQGLAGLSNALSQRHGVQLQRMQRVQQAEAELTARQEFANLDREVQSRFREAMSNRFTTGELIENPTDILSPETRQDLLDTRLTEIRESALGRITTPDGRAAFESRMDDLEMMYQESFIEKETNLMRAWSNSQIPSIIDRIAENYAFDPALREVGIQLVDQLLSDSVASGAFNAAEATQEQARSRSIFARTGFAEYNENPVMEDGTEYGQNQWDEALEGTYDYIDQLYEAKYADGALRSEMREIAQQTREARVEAYTSGLTSEYARVVITSAPLWNAQEQTREGVYQQLTGNLSNDEGFQKLSNDMQNMVYNGIWGQLTRVITSEGVRNKTTRELIDERRTTIIADFNATAASNFDQAVEELIEELADDNLWVGGPEIQALRTELAGDTSDWANPNSDFLKAARESYNNPGRGATISQDVKTYMETQAAAYGVPKDSQFMSALWDAAADAAGVAQEGMGVASQDIKREEVDRVLSDFNMSILQGVLDLDNSAGFPMFRNDRERSLDNMGAGADRLAAEGINTEATMTALRPVLNAGNTTVFRRVMAPIIEQLVIDHNFEVNDRGIQDRSQVEQTVRNMLGGAEAEDQAPMEPIVSLVMGTVEFAMGAALHGVRPGYADRTVAIKDVLMGTGGTMIVAIETAAVNQEGQRRTHIRYYGPAQNDADGSLMLQQYGVRGTGFFKLGDSYPFRRGIASRDPGESSPQYSAEEQSARDVLGPSFDTTSVENAERAVSGLRGMRTQDQYVLNRIEAFEWIIENRGTR